MDKKLRYRISSWHQLSKCQSNISNDLSIRVTDLIQDERLSGIKISVRHIEYEDLFTCLINSTGALVDDEVAELSPDTIFEQLSRFGFLVSFSQKFDISKSQLDTITGIQKLGYDKIRVLNVIDRVNNQYNSYIVAFLSSYNQNWLNNAYCSNTKELSDAVVSGQAICIQALSELNRYDWSWLYGYVLGVDDIISQHNSEIYQHELSDK